MTKALRFSQASRCSGRHERRRAIEADSLEGVWQTVEVTVTGPGARTITVPEPRPNLMIVRPFTTAASKSMPMPHARCWPTPEGNRRRAAGRLGLVHRRSRYA
jgi:hypothetical protein